MKNPLQLSARFKLKRSEFARTFLPRATEIGVLAAGEEPKERPKAVRTRPWQKPGSTRSRILAALFNK